ncbi:MAG: hypothetical protein LBP73_04120 [Clostridiales Family XIII bacterium]|jgi:hypothetical protein|nr:hypothetical protein [Clostridiales Family XIII bacterium]
MNRDAILLELEETRELLLVKINARVDALIEGVKSGEPLDESSPAVETVWPLGIKPGLFKGTRPVAVHFGDERVEVKKWRAVYALILRRCAEEPEMREALMSLRNKISGRTRTILSDKPDGMDCPIEIAEGIFVEGYFDTEWLIKTLTVEILGAIGYDCGDISIAVVPGKKRRR